MAIRITLGPLIAIALASSAHGAPPQRPVKVFILAGQSNMAGQGVVDLHDDAHNHGKGTLEALINDPAKGDRFRHLKDEAGGWRVRDDVRVWFQPEDEPLRSGALTIGFTAHQGRHHFGPELQFGHVLGDAMDNEVLLIKTAWGGKSLYSDFRPPSSDGPTGPSYTLMIREIQEALAKLSLGGLGSNSPGFELAGFVWYQVTFPQCLYQFLC